MRIISGKWKGRKLQAPKNLPTRPTTDFAKEGLFNVLNSRFYFEDLQVLDLFAGIGSISYEFASRGCQSVTGVDKHAACVKFISQTKEQLELDNLQIFKADVFSFLAQNQGLSYDLIFADPPFEFEKESYQEILDLVLENQLLKPEGTLILEHSKKMDLSDFPNYKETKKYGNVHFSFFSK
ncbi:16S rRNA (guanine(966)-N(2))-methyltransferase RsmD [Ornithobacterium rhinotracheale]|uniref:16S rRNA (guanine(966)-N(2))-methyltransferase RsmD n=1 Tax=Ornithobacterium rhinotracheale TaxID=28251 RepID=UPI004034FDAA